jgi:hypothetical protein
MPLPAIIRPASVTTDFLCVARLFSLVWRNFQSFMHKHELLQRISSYDPPRIDHHHFVNEDGGYGGGNVRQ